MSLFEIDSFQFDNLVKNRVGFCLLNLAQEFPKLYDGIFQAHVNNALLQCTKSQCEETLRTQKVPHDFGIVIVCESGTDSALACETLFSKGYKNVYCVRGGIVQLKSVLGANLQ